VSDNPISAGNQQERLYEFVSEKLGHYLAGFADGEGSFNISFRPREDYRSPWKVSACFNISQKERAILTVFQKTLGCGTLRSRPDGVWYYEVNTLKDIQQCVIPFFQTFPFLSEKKIRDFQLFTQLVAMLQEGKQHSRSGIESILEIRRPMNGGGKRKFSEEDILKRFHEESSETIRQTRISFDSGMI